MADGRPQSKSRHRDEAATASERAQMSHTPDKIRVNENGKDQVDDDRRPGAVKMRVL
jgi:hypothetical protein